jgi:thymidylate kinase
MKSASTTDRAIVIELAGLPGAGKTSICEQVGGRFLGRGDIGIARLRPSRELWRVSVAVLRLAFSIRPFSPTRIGRAFDLIAFLRYYMRNCGLPVIVDQGLVQKLWSTLIESQSYSDSALEDTVDALAPFAPDVLVFLEIPPDVAAERIAARVGGNSRFDLQSESQIASRLRPLSAQYAKLLGLVAHNRDICVLNLDGTAPVAENARQLADLCKGRPAREVSPSGQSGNSQSLDG